MNISYLLSVLDLYLLREKTNQLIIQVDNITNLVKVSFGYANDTLNLTFVKIDKENFFNNLKEILTKIQGNYEAPQEKFSILKNRNTYTLNFSSKRILSFIGFNIEEMQIIRNNIQNLQSDFKFYEEDNYNKQLLNNKDTKLSFQMGFANYMTIALSSLFLLDILMISLWIFKAFMS